MIHHRGPSLKQHTPFTKGRKGCFRGTTFVPRPEAGALTLSRATRLPFSGTPPPWSSSEGGFGCPCGSAHTGPLRSLGAGRRPTFPVDAFVCPLNIALP